MSFILTLVALRLLIISLVVNEDEGMFVNALLFNLIEFNVYKVLEFKFVKLILNELLPGL
ncbi:hypothetical protein NW739_00440 [Mycoplasmopsis felis]|uniref:hypothetical protein n=1 Tax=Mycoplasmopsis felis TaxID=33923 RepID=UPI0021B08546|nr:hypothetical protein [Mycoplasmopsis felis]MCU9931978.1 hypothetical protein [Mycoplasmopsis felis]MCU9933692.1 hypothetical protein [Mycoplasmopsis felis]MCU9939315.1 hypothetical protein [Mycoplasmopsis felis]UWV78414.1 hypothetical protein NWE59_06085 [Mycoplasmopsis felis]UWV79271.1 hypothetical protein NW072_04390 [Mycoplasmopsis felis]